MKKLFFLVIISFLVLSCTDDDKDGTNIQTINLSAKAGDWKWIDNDPLQPYYKVTYTMPEIYSWIYNNGVVNVYQTFSGGTQPLPVVRHNQDNAGVLWTRTIDYEYGLKTLTIFVTDSDFQPDPPGNMTFKVALIW